MGIQEWAIRTSFRDHQRQVGEIAMLKGQAERARALGTRSRALIQRDMEQII